MKFILSLVLLATVTCHEMLITREMTEYLKNTVSWEVQDYETNIFRGWTVEEADQLFGSTHNVVADSVIEEYEPRGVSAPSSINWAGASCDHGVGLQGDCGSGWAFSIADMLGFRCCTVGTDYGWLSPQELVACDTTSHGCDGGYLEAPMKYIQYARGLVQDRCFTYRGKQALACPFRCDDGNNWGASHVCNCAKYRVCAGDAAIKDCLMSGPITFAFTVRDSFLFYKAGIYACDGSVVRGAQVALLMGRSEDSGCYYVAKNSWGTQWGVNGYFYIACNTCEIAGGVACTNF